ncbi:unnamed protein product [Didymodactylos carnosus]|uniref:Uncharacterized protein n=1 Tax=Didymodactylos carnosus TaxID=1234261 RepID=A0A815CGA1_9BILA|nr:unnamed protein product [Didymodactylos carnosus]CAF4088984.1 unnamed protein product [Didymodactylos carnosus]
MLRSYTIILFLISNVSSEFILHDTNQVVNRTKVTGRSEYHCLYSYTKENDGRYVMIPYCIRSTEEELIDDYKHELYLLNDTNIKGQRFSFQDMKQNNITIGQLFRWNAPLDKIEQYDIYFKNTASTIVKDQDYYYNCTRPWFGPRCQYTFDLESDEKEEFSAIVHQLFKKKHVSKPDWIVLITNGTCYTNLICASILCLDWREICDQKIDCSIWDEFIHQVNWEKAKSKKTLIEELKRAVNRIRQEVVLESCESWTKRLYRLSKNNGDYLQ